LITHWCVQPFGGCSTDGGRAVRGGKKERDV
jgi:hypothetical protein